MTLRWPTRLLLSVVRWVAMAGPGPRLRLSQLFFWLGWILGGQRKKIARANLMACFPEMAASQVNDLVRRHFQAYARAFVDRFVLWFAPPSQLREMVQLTGWEHFTPHDGKPVIVFAPHFLGLEAGGMRFQLERRVVNLYSHQGNPELDEWTLKGRTRFNDPVLIARDDGVASAIRWLKKGVAFHFSPDMDLGRRESMFVDFFNVPAATVASMVRIARISGAVVVPLVTRMTAGGYEARFYPAWHHPLDDATESLEAGVRRMNAFIEDRIRELPEQYLWTHRRFKTRPPGQPDVYA